MDKDCNSNSTECVDCKHEQWIKAWQQRERRKQQLFDGIKSDTIKWAVIGTLGYFALLLIDVIKTKMGWQ